MNTIDIKGLTKNDSTFYIVWERVCNLINTLPIFRVVNRIPSDPSQTLECWGRPKFFAQNTILEGGRSTNMKISLKDRLDAINMSAALFSEYSGLSTAQLSRFMNGKQDPTEGDQEAIERWLGKLEDIHYRSQPLPLDFRNVARVRDLMTKLRQQKLSILVHDYELEERKEQSEDK